LEHQFGVGGTRGAGVIETLGGTVDMKGRIRKSRTSISQKKKGGGYREKRKTNRSKRTKTERAVPKHTDLKERRITTRRRGGRRHQGGKKPPINPIL